MYIFENLKYVYIYSYTFVLYLYFYWLKILKMSLWPIH